MKLKRFREVASTIIESLPVDLFRQLNGGVLIIEEKNEEEDSLVMGEYVEDPVMGKTILLYYGSFVEDLEDTSEEKWIDEIEDTILHELRHHVESLAGVDYLSEEEGE
jgi:predicted Zn-dependent protease with MMP-like domain